MTILGTNIAAIKTELVSRFSGRAGLSAVTVSFQPPTQTMPDDSIWFAGATIDYESVAFKASGGMVEIQEDVDLTLVVQALNDDTQTAADTQAVAMLGEVMEEIATYPTLEANVAGLLRITPVSAEHETGLLGNTSRYASAFKVTIGASSLIKST